jgi:hypothetical protein
MNARPWYREPMLALVIGLPLAAVVASFATLVIAARGHGDAMDHGVRRVAQTQTTDLRPDHEAARLGLEATLSMDADGSVALQFQSGAPPAGPLALTLRHSADPGRDRIVALEPRDGTRFGGMLLPPRAAGAYNLTLAPPDGAWRLVGRLDAGSRRAALQAALVE